MKNKIAISVLTFLLIGLLSSGCQDNRHALAVSKIKAAAKLATTEVSLSKIIFATKERKFIFGLIKLNDARFAARTMATIKAGINLEEITSDDVKIEGETITIVLPAVKVLDFKYPFQSYEVDFSITANESANDFTI